MKRRQLLVSVTVLAGSLLAVNFLAKASLSPAVLLAFDTFLLLLGFSVLFKKRPAHSVNREAGRLLNSIFLYILAFAFQAGTMYLAKTVEGNPRAEYLWVLISRVFPALSFAWTLLIISRLGGEGWFRKRRHIVVTLTLAVMFALLRAPVIFVAIVGLYAILFVFPYQWLVDLKGKGRWLGLVLFFVAPTASLFYFAGDTFDSLTGFSGREVDLMSRTSLLYIIGLTMAQFYVFLPVRILVAGLQGAFGLRIPIWLKLGFTYVFSTLIPAILMVILVTLAMYTGIGTLRVDAVRNLIQDDMGKMEQGLRTVEHQDFGGLDSVSVGVYRRIGDVEVPTVVTIPAGNVGRTAGGIEEPLSISPVGDDYSQFGYTHGLGIRPSSRGDSQTYWVLEETLNSDFPMPDTLSPFPGWETNSFSVHGLLATDDDRTSLAVAIPESEYSERICVALCPLNQSLVDRYKKIIGADVIIQPSREAIYLRNVENKAVTVENSSIFFEGFNTIGAIKSKIDDAKGNILQVPLYQGVGELMRWSNEENEDQELLGFIVVRTSISELAKSLYNTRGLNIIVIALLSLLGFLFILAVLFSSILAFGISSTITSAVSELRSGTEKLRKGELGHKLKVRNRDELGELAVSFNRMSADLSRLVGSIAEKERLERDIHIAREIQKKLLPAKLPQCDCLEISAMSDPAQEVGGDYYDVIEFAENKYMVAVGDVSGKGIPAAILMSNLQANLQVLIRQQFTIEEIVNQLNQTICNNSTSEMFITFFVGIIDIENQSLTYVNAGHDHPFLIRKNKIIELETGGMLLGIVPGYEYESETIELRPEDLLALYSDGVTEVMDENEEEFGAKRLIQGLKSLNHAPARNIVDGIYNMAHQFAGNRKTLQDDFTLVVVKMVESIPVEQ